MNLDGLLIGKYAMEINKYLPAKINKISQISEQSFLFQIRNRGKNHQLFISTQSNSYRFHITQNNYNTSFEPSTFLMVLRKALTQSIILNVTQLNGDRCIKFEIETLNNIKDKIRLNLYIELFGKYTNIILVNQDNKIIDCLKRNSLSNNRILLPQANFEASYNTEKYNLFETQQFLLDKYNGISKAILNMNFDASTLYTSIINSNTIYFYPQHNKFHLIPLYNEPCTTYTLFEAMDKIYNIDETLQRTNELSGNIFQFVKKELTKSKNKLHKLHQNLNDAKNLETYKKYGELLYAIPLQDHIEEANVIDFEGRNITIPLDKKYTIKENARRYYKKYTKSKTALTMIEEQIRKTNENIHYFTNIQDQLDYIQLEDALEIASELHLNTKKQIKYKKNKHPNFLILEINNVKIYVGKNNIQNDYITNKISKKHYLWFHVKDFHGSHVIVNQSEVSEETLRLCAMLAAYYSKARHSSSIPVDYCLLKELKSTRGNQVGMVYLGKHKTIYIDIDESYLMDIIHSHQPKL